MCKISIQCGDSSASSLADCCSPCLNNPCCTSALVVMTVVTTIFAVSIAITANAFPGMGLSVGARVGIFFGMNIVNFLIMTALAGCACKRCWESDDCKYFFS